MAHSATSWRILALVDARGVLAVPHSAVSTDVFFIRYDQDAPRRRYGSMTAAIDDLSTEPSISRADRDP